MKAINAIIKDVDLKNDYVLDMPITLELANGGLVVFGGICLGHLEKAENENENYAAHYICKILDVVGVNKFSRLIGKPVRAIFTGNGSIGDSCIGVQNFLKFENYFIPDKKYQNLSDFDIKSITED